MDDLRSSLIRLASANPSLRPHLLPILKEAAPRLPDGHPRKRLPPARWNTPVEDLPWPTKSDVGNDVFEKALDKALRAEFDWWVRDMVKGTGTVDRPRDSLAMIRTMESQIQSGLRDFRQVIQNALMQAHREASP